MFWRSKTNHCKKKIVSLKRRIKVSKARWPNLSLTTKNRNELCQIWFAEAPVPTFSATCLPLITITCARHKQCPHVQTEISCVWAWTPNIKNKFYVLVHQQRQTDRGPNGRVLLKNKQYRERVVVFQIVIKKVSWYEFESSWFQSWILLIRVTLNIWCNKLWLYATNGT